VNSGLDHWAPGTSYLGQECDMTPSITVGTRKEFNELDFAGLDDLGWDLTPVPEPTTVFALAAVGLAGAWGIRRRRPVKVTHDSGHPYPPSGGITVPSRNHRTDPEERALDRG
jgi:hypothetical protein